MYNDIESGVATFFEVLRYNPMELSKHFEKVEILNSDFRKVIRRHSNNSEAFFLIDPPYYGCRNYYKNDFTWKDHEDLAKLLQKVRGKWMVCHDANEQIKELYTSLGFTYVRICIIILD